MQVLIDISKNNYERLKAGDTNAGNTFHNTALEAIGNGMPLPEGHGRLVILSEDAMKKELMPLSFSCQKWISEVGLSNATVVIIGADKGAENNETTSG